MTVVLPVTLVVDEQDASGGYIEYVVIGLQLLVRVLWYWPSCVLARSLVWVL